MYSGGLSALYQNPPSSPACAEIPKVEAPRDKTDSVFFKAEFQLPRMVPDVDA